MRIEAAAIVVLFCSHRALKMPAHDESSPLASFRCSWSSVERTPREYSTPRTVMRLLCILVSNASADIRNARTGMHALAIASISAQQANSVRGTLRKPVVFVE